MVTLKFALAIRMAVTVFLDPFFLPSKEKEKKRKKNIPIVDKILKSHLDCRGGVIALVIISVIILLSRRATRADAAFVGEVLSLGLPLFQARQNPDIIAKQSH